jgi:hypothetical protein
MVLALLPTLAACVNMRERAALWHTAGNLSRC